MNNCLNFMELISSYIDGEISETEKKNLEAHIETCESCASFLRAYKGISSAVEAGETVPPPSLRENVMAKIKSGPAILNAHENDRSKIIRLTLRRYVPLAACVAIIILAMLPISRQWNSKSKPDAGTNMAMPPSAAPVPSPSALAPSGGLQRNETTPFAANEMDAPAEDSDTSAMRPALEGTGLAPPASPGATMPALTDISEPENGTDKTETSGGETLDYNVSEYFALVRVDGQLPELLSDVILIADEDGTSYAFIPAEDVEALVSLGYGAEYHNKDAATAIVVYIEG